MSDWRGQVSIIHAFSRRNAGDGLLVDLTLELLSDAGVEPHECQILALDPESFEGNENVSRVPGEPAARMSRKLFGAAGELGLSLAGRGKVRKLLQHSRAIVAVGGGYLVGDSPIRQAGIMLNHYAQLRSAAAAGCPTIYLPQSIGALHPPTSALIRSRLREIDCVWARDDKTAKDLPWANVRRCPDLAVMKLGKNLSTMKPSAASGAAVIVGRDLPNAGGLLRDLKELGHKLDGSMWAVQAETEGSRSDREFYRRLGVEPAGRLVDVLKHPTGPVVSVRMHGAIAALLAGRPAIHLAYERKGWGAFEDMGLEAYVHDARNLNVDVVVEQVLELQRDPKDYWGLVRRASDRLATSWEMVASDVKRRLSGARPVENSSGVIQG